MHDYNKTIAEYIGLLKYLADGCDGEGVMIATDYFDPGYSRQLGYNVHVIDPTMQRSAFDDHRRKAATVIWEFLPKATIVPIPLQQTSRINGEVMDFDRDVIPMLAELGVSIIFTSEFNGAADPSAREKALKEHPYITYISSAGNDETGKNPTVDCARVWGIGAYELTNGKPIPRHDSVASAGVDFCAPSGIMIKPYPTMGPNVFPKTSSASPMQAVMKAVLDCLYLKKTGMPCRNDEALQLMIDHALDIADPGKDQKTGWGAVILPDPADINIEGEITVPITPPTNEPEKDYYETIDDVPDYWRDDIKELIAVNAINGGTDNDINDKDVNLSPSETKVAVILKRYIDSKQVGT